MQGRKKYAAAINVKQRRAKYGNAGKAHGAALGYIAQPRQG
jgi:hypothetical protein